MLRPVYTAKIMHLQCELIQIDYIHMEFALSWFKLKLDWANPPIEVVWMCTAIWIQIDFVIIYLHVIPYSLRVTIETKESTIHRDINRSSRLLVNKHIDDGYLEHRRNNSWTSSALLSKAFRCLQCSSLWNLLITLRI